MSDQVMNFALWLAVHGVGQRGCGRWNAGELAQSAGISRAASYAYVAGTRVPDDPKVISRIARVLGVALADIPTFQSKTANKTEPVQPN